MDLDPYCFSFLHCQVIVFILIAVYKPAVNLQATMRMKSKMAANLVFQGRQKARGFFLRHCPCSAREDSSQCTFFFLFFFPVHFYIHLSQYCQMATIKSKKSGKVSVLAFEPLCQGNTGWIKGIASDFSMVNSMQETLWFLICAIETIANMTEYRHFWLLLTSD